MVTCLFSCYVNEMLLPLSYEKRSEKSLQHNMLDQATLIENGLLSLKQQSLVIYNPRCYSFVHHFSNFNRKKASYHEFVNLFFPIFVHRILQELDDQCGKYNPNLCRLTYNSRKIYYEIFNIITSYMVLQCTNSSHYILLLYREAWPTDLEQQDLQLYKH